MSLTPEILALESAAEELKNQGKLEEAIAKYQEALTLDADFVRGHLALSVLFHQTQDHASSVRHGERAFQLEPNDPFNAAALSVTYQRAFEGTRDPIYIQKAESVNTNLR